MFGLLTAIALSTGLAGPAANTPSQPTTTATRAEFERLQGFATVVLNHVSDTLGTDKLPAAAGLPLEPAVFATVLPDRLQIYDADVVGLDNGRVGGNPVVTAAECVSQCPAVFFDAFQQTWLEAAIESTVHAVQIPQRVLFAMHRDIPAVTLLQMAYAAAETRPVSPPSMHLLVNSSRGGLRAQPFYLVPPEGLTLAQGSAALGLTIEMSRDKFVIKATDPRYARENTITDREALRRLLGEIKKRYPGKETVIVVPDDQITVGEMISSYSLIQAWFPRMVLSAGQRVRTP